MGGTLSSLSSGMFPGQPRPVNWAGLRIRRGEVRRSQGRADIRTGPRSPKPLTPGSSPTAPAKIKFPIT